MHAYSYVSICARLYLCVYVNVPVCIFMCCTCINGIYTYLCIDILILKVVLYKESIDLLFFQKVYRYTWKYDFGEY